MPNLAPDVMQYELIFDNADLKHYSYACNPDFMSKCSYKLAFGIRGVLRCKPKHRLLMHKLAEKFF